jgi:hypothetical protein
MRRSIRLLAVACAALVGLLQAGQAQSPSRPAGEASPLAKVAIDVVVGPPESVGQQLNRDLSAALDRRRIAAAGRDERTDFSLRWYVLAQLQKAATKVSFVLDVVDATGRRVNRFAGEELVPGPSPDPWAAVAPPVTQALATKAADALAAWLPHKP